MELPHPSLVLPSGSLARLEGAWSAQGAPISAHLAPGATTEYLDQVEARLGCVLAPELRAWWGWHDGVRRLQPDLRYGPEAHIGPGGWEFLSATESLDERDLRRARSDGASDADEDWQGGWRVEWLPFVTMDAYALFVDCRQVTTTGTAPVRHYAHTPEDVFTPRTGSLRQLVDIWTYLLEEGFYVWDASAQSWADRYSEIPWPLRGLH